MTQLPALKKLHLALMAGAALTCVLPAQAGVVYVDLSAAPINIPVTIAGVYLNVVTGAYGTASAATGWDINPYASASNLNFFSPTAISGAYVGSTTGPAALTLGTTISSASTFTATTTGTAFRVTGQEYLGFRFLNESTGVTNYGWALINTTGTTGFPASIAAYAYENTGAGITIAAVPEPATYAMFGAGALALMALRRRRSS